MLLPITNTINVRACRPGMWLDSGVVVPGTDTTTQPESVVLEAPRYSKEEQALGPAPEPFWSVRRVSTDQERPMANMEVQRITVAGACAAHLQGWTCKDAHQLEIELPVMVLTKDVSQGEELVCWWPSPEQAPAIKKTGRARVPQPAKS